MKRSLKLVKVKEQGKMMRFAKHMINLDYHEEKVTNGNGYLRFRSEFPPNNLQMFR